MVTIVDVYTSQGYIKVEKDEVYTVKVGDVVTCKSGNADEIIAMLGSYIENTYKEPTIPDEELFELLEGSSEYEYIFLSKSIYSASYFIDSMINIIQTRNKEGWVLIDLLSANGDGNRLFRIHSTDLKDKFKHVQHLKWKDLADDTKSLIKSYFLNNMKAICQSGVSGKHQVLEAIGCRCTCDNPYDYRCELDE